MNNSNLCNLVLSKIVAFVFVHPLENEIKASLGECETMQPGHWPSLWIMPCRWLYSFCMGFVVLQYSL